MSTFEVNPHLLYECAYIRLFAGQWHVEGSLDIPSDSYGLAVSLINAVALAMEAHNTSLLRENYPPFPNFSYTLTLMRHAHVLALAIGQSPFHTAREVAFRDLSQAPFPRSVESLVNECEQKRGWRNCLAVSFLGDILVLPIEQRTALIETEAHILAERLIAMYQQEPKLHPHPLSAQIVDKEHDQRMRSMRSSRWESVSSM